MYRNGHIVLLLDLFSYIYYRGMDDMIENRVSSSLVGTCNQEPNMCTNPCTCMQFPAVLAWQGWPTYRFSAKRVSNLNLILRSCVQVSALQAKDGGFDMSLLFFFWVLLEHH